MIKTREQIEEKLRELWIYYKELKNNPNRVDDLIEVMGEIKILKWVLGIRSVKEIM